MCLNVIFNCILLLTIMVIVDCHITGDNRQLSELKKICEHAYSCFHDVIMICGKSVNEARTFLDLCDLYEYSCEYNMIFRHVKDEEGICPDPRRLVIG